MELYTLASFSIRSSMNIQTSPASTHSQQLRDPLVDNHTSDWLQGSLWRQKHQRFQTSFLGLSLAHCRFKEKKLSNGECLWIYKWFVWKHI